uniref:Uncharacterized protein n=1 Tax=Caenorhabditis japonica TaxID=281687 RepID=A0A8R1IMV1_CAEJA
MMPTVHLLRWSPWKSIGSGRRCCQPRKTRNRGKHHLDTICRAGCCDTRGPDSWKTNCAREGVGHCCKRWARQIRNTSDQWWQGRDYGRADAPRREQASSRLVKVWWQEKEEEGAVPVLFEMAGR